MDRGQRCGWSEPVPWGKSAAGDGTRQKSVPGGTDTAAPLYVVVSLAMICFPIKINPVHRIQFGGAQPLYRSKVKQFH